MLKIELQSERLQFCSLTKKHLNQVYRLHSLPQVAQYNTIGIPKNIAVTHNVLQGKLDPSNFAEHGWVLFDQEGLFIGEMGLVLAPERFRKAEISYSIHPNCWNYGYATEALERLIRFAFDTLQLHRIEAGGAVSNKASIRVLEKAGLQREGRHRKILPRRDGWEDNYSYGILSFD